MGREIILIIVKYLNFLECRNDENDKGPENKGIKDFFLSLWSLFGKNGKTKAYKLGQKQEILLVTANLTCKTKEKLTSVKF